MKTDPKHLIPTPPAGYERRATHLPWLAWEEGTVLHFTITGSREYAGRDGRVRSLYEVELLESAPTSDGEMLPAGAPAVLGVRTCIANLGIRDSAWVRVTGRAGMAWTADVYRQAAGQ